MPPLRQTLKGLLAGFLTVLEEGAYKLQGPKEGSAKWFEGNFVPLPYKEADLFAPGLTIEGELPSELNGVFARIGPNPVFVNSGYHWFDGDGFVHAIKLDAATQSANYSGQFVRTNKLEQELAAGRGLHFMFGDMRGPLSLAHLMITSARNFFKIVDNSKGRFTANTAMVWHANQLYALHEAEQPHLLRIEPDGRISTVGLVHKAGPSPASYFTAHPKIDPVTKKLYAFGYDLVKAPYTTFYQIDEAGQEIRHVPLDFTKACMTHDFAITEHKAIFFEVSLCINPKEMVKNNAPLFTFDEEKPMRIGVLPLDATSGNQTQWFEGKPGFLFHSLNAWEEDGGKRVRVLTMRYSYFDLNFDGSINSAAAIKAGVYSKEELARRASHLYEYVLDLETGAIEEKLLVSEETDARLWEFPRTHPALLGRTSRYAYASALEERGDVLGVIKIDLEDDFKVQELDGGGHYASGEALYIPRKDAESEDDGYILFFTWCPDTNTSDFRVYDAKTFDSTPIATVKLPRRVPYGFHAVFIPQEELEQQSCPVVGE